MPFPTDWTGGTARLIRYAARLSLSSAATWLPAGSTTLTSSVDSGANDSTLDVALADTVSDDLTGSGMSADGSPLASVYLALLAGISDGTNLAEAERTTEAVITTGHPFFSVLGQPAGSTWIQAVVTLGATPPTITDGNGFTWTQLAQEQFGGGWLTVWSAPITRTTTTVIADEKVTLSEQCDSGIGLGFVGQTL